MSSMSICLCNRLSQAMIDQAVGKGARTPTDVFRHYRMRRGCSSCSVQVAEAIDRARDRPAVEAAE
jgi:bacterioferritin-associated ferredoxin